MTILQRSNKIGTFDKREERMRKTDREFYRIYKDNIHEMKCNGFTIQELDDYIESILSMYNR